jgi:hypothetical protein
MIWDDQQGDHLLRSALFLRTLRDLGFNGSLNNQRPDTTAAVPPGFLGFVERRQHPVSFRNPGGRCKWRCRCWQ